jgi:hypothetical protein
MDRIGLWKIAPTSVSGTGVSIAANGEIVVASGSTNFTVNGAFNSSFRNYKIIVSDFVTNTVSGLSLSLGTSLTGSAHKWSTVAVPTSGSVAVTGSSGTTRWALPCVSRSSAFPGGCEVTVLQPNIATETIATGSGAEQAVDSLGRSFYGFHEANTAFTSIYFTTQASETITSCRISIYGYN